MENIPFDISIYKLLRSTAIHRYVVPSCAELLRPVNNITRMTVIMILNINIILRKNNNFKVKVQYSKIGYATKINRFHTRPRSNGIYNVVYYYAQYCVQKYNSVIVGEN